MQFLIIQTAFLGDVILATSLVEKLHKQFPSAKIDFLLKKGNETVLNKHPFLREILILDKQNNKWKSLIEITKKVKSKKYETIINLHRFGSSGYIVWRSNAKIKVGFKENPFSFCYTKRIKHEIRNGKHETDRNSELISDITNNVVEKPRLYPTEQDKEFVKPYKSKKYYCIAPASIWFTKQFPTNKWSELASYLNPEFPIYLLGASQDFLLCEEIRNNALKFKREEQILNLAGKLTLLQTAELIHGAIMNYVNDSAPLHIASAMNSPVTVIFCSTIPEFGFGPLSDISKTIETKEILDCRPCGIHGHKKCPKNHFRCATSISVKEII